MKIGRFTIKDPFKRGSVKFEYKPEKGDDGKEQEYSLRGNCDLTEFMRERNMFSCSANVKYGGYGTKKIQSWQRMGGSLAAGGWNTWCSENIVVKHNDKVFNLLLTSNYSKYGYSDAYTAFVASGFKWGKFWLRGKLTPD